MSTSTDQSQESRRSDAREERPKAAHTQHWHELREEARGYFNATAQAQAAAATEAKSDQRLRMRQTSLDDNQSSQLAALRHWVRGSGDQYLDSISQSNVLAPGFNDDARLEKMDAMQRVYTQMMLQGCLRPLKEGVGVSSIVQSIGVMSALTLMSPDFRAQLGSHVQPLRDDLERRIDARARSKAEQAQATGQPLSGRWAKRVEFMDHQERGHRFPYTPTTAALAEVGLMENTAERMRAPGADAKTIHETYTGLRAHLHEQCEADGLERSEVVSNVRTIIGNRIQGDPEMATYFHGFAHGRVERAPDHEVRVPGASTNSSIWTGEFQDHHGQPLPSEGTPRLRMPMNAAEHQVQLTETLRTALERSAERGDVNGYRGDVLGYSIGFAAAGEQLDLEGLPNRLTQRFEAAELAMASMQIDGLDREQMAEVFSNAQTDAMERTHEKFPQFVQDVESAWGETWVTQMSQVARDPQGFVETIRGYASAAREHQGPRQRPHARAQQPPPQPAPDSPDHDRQPV